jgi:predicted permease
MRLWRRGRRDRELTEEIETHLVLAEAEHRRRGLSEQEARDAARRDFGGIMKTRQAYREQRGVYWLDVLVQDARFGLRMLRRDRGFAVTAALVLGIGIGANNLMFTLLYGSTLRGLPIARADRVVFISTFDQRFPDRPLSFQDFDDVRTQARSFSTVAAFYSTPMSVGDEGRAPDRVDGAYATVGALEIAGKSPILGRTFAADEDRSGAPAVAVLSQRLWRARYGGDATILGRTIIVNGAPAIVIGIMPDRSGFPGTAEVWLPLAHIPDLASQRRDARTLRVFGRVRDGVTVNDARRDVESIVAAISRNHPDSSEGLAARVVPINQRFFGGLSNPVWLPFIAASLLVVMVSCANAANLMIGRSVLRAREVAIRGSLGATRIRVVSQFLIEALVLAAAGGLAGFVISLGAARLFESGIPEQTLPYWLHYSMDWRIFGALVVVAAGSVLIFGLLPAIHASRVDPGRVMKEGGRGGSSGNRRTRLLTSAFLIAEFALSVVLLSQLSVSFLAQAPTVESTKAVTTPALMAATVTLPAAKYGSANDRLAFFDRALEQLQSTPGIVSVTVTGQLPFSGGPEQRLELDGTVVGQETRAPAVLTITIGPDYFSTLDVRLLQGREFNARDGHPGSAAAIVNERFAERYFSQGDAIGRLIRVTAPNAPTDGVPWLTVVGVASNIRQRNLADPDPVVYVPLASSPLPTASFIVRSDRDPAASASRVREEVSRIDPHLPLYRVMTMKQAVEDALWNARASHRLILSITVIALALSMVGLYAVTAYSVGQRTQEIGIRVALGARPREIGALILRRALVQVTLGFVLGMGGGLVWDSTFVSGRIGLRLASPEVLAPVMTLLALLAIVACWVPVRRATRLDPVAALRHD